MNPALTKLGIKLAASEVGNNLLERARQSAKQRLATSNQEVSSGDTKRSGRLHTVLPLSSQSLFATSLLLREGAKLENLNDAFQMINEDSFRKQTAELVQSLGGKVSNTFCDALESRDWTNLSSNQMFGVMDTIKEQLNLQHIHSKSLLNDQLRTSFNAVVNNYLQDSQMSMHFTPDESRRSEAEHDAKAAHEQFTSTFSRSPSK